MATRWANYIADGTFSLSVPKDTPLGGKDGKGRLAEFWTTPYPYWNMRERDEELWNDLRNSSLVIFKVRKPSVFFLMWTWMSHGSSPRLSFAG